MKKPAGERGREEERSESSSLGRDRCQGFCGGALIARRTPAVPAPVTARPAAHTIGPAESFPPLPPSARACRMRSRTRWEGRGSRSSGR